MLIKTTNGYLRTFWFSWYSQAGTQSFCTVGKKCKKLLNTVWEGRNHHESNHGFACVFSMQPHTHTHKTVVPRLSEILMVHENFFAATVSWWYNKRVVLLKRSLLSVTNILLLGWPPSKQLGSYSHHTATDADDRNFVIVPHPFESGNSPQMRPALLSSVGRCAHNRNTECRRVTLGHLCTLRSIASVTLSHTHKHKQQHITFKQRENMF